MFNVFKIFKKKEPPINLVNSTIDKVELIKLVENGFLLMYAERYIDFYLTILKNDKGGLELSNLTYKKKKLKNVLFEEIKICPWVLKDKTYQSLYDKTCNKVILLNYLHKKDDNFKKIKNLIYV